MRPSASRKVTGSASARPASTRPDFKKAIQRLEATIDDARRAHRDETGVSDDGSFLLWMNTLSGELWRRKIEDATRLVQERTAVVPIAED